MTQSVDGLTGDCLDKLRESSIRAADSAGSANCGPPGTKGTPRRSSWRTRRAPACKSETPLMVRTQPATLRLGPVVAPAFLLAGVAFLPFAMRPDHVTTYFLALLLTVLTLLPIVTRLAAGTLDVFEPIILISALIGLDFGVRSMYLAYEPATLQSLRLGPHPYEDYIERALILMTAAYVSLLAGYYVVSRAIRFAPSRRTVSIWPASRVSGVKVATLLVVGAATTAVRIQLGDVNGMSAFNDVTETTFILNQLSFGGQYVACILALYIAAGDSRRWLRLTILLGALPLCVFQSLVFGTKTAALLPLYAIVAARHYVKRPLQLSVLVAGAVITMLVVFPPLNAFRSNERGTFVSSRSGAAEFARSVAFIPTYFAGMGVSDYLALAGESVMARATGIDSLSLLMKYDQFHELGDGSSYLNIPLYAFVPRLLWPDKPTVNRGGQFGSLFVVPIEEAANSFTSFGVFHTGDLLASFGVIGVLIGLCLLGCLYRVTYNFFDPRHSLDLGTKFIYIFLLWNMINGFESDIPTVYGNILKSLIVWTAIKMWMNVRTAPGPLRVTRVPSATNGAIRATGSSWKNERRRWE